MKITSEDCVVAIEYEVKELGSDKIVDTNKGAQPLEFIIGKGNIIPGLEDGLIGMSKGESSEIEVKSARAYGEINPEAKQILPVDNFEGVDLKEGMTLYGQGENGETVQVTVVSFDDKEVHVDFNHPLAGKDLMFSVEVVEVREATEDEKVSGQVGGSCNNDNESCGCSH